MENLHFFFCFLLIFSGYFVAFSVNPINSVISLIITFLIAAMILYLFNVEFLGTLFIIIYVGAIAVLFLFVIMMLNIKTQELVLLSKYNIIKCFLVFMLYHFFLAVFSIVFTCIFTKESFFNTDSSLIVLSFLENLYNINILGQTLFNYTAVCVLIAGLILLISLLGAIVLTLKNNSLQKNQLITRQLAKSTNVLIYKKV